MLQKLSKYSIRINTEEKRLNSVFSFGQFQYIAIKINRMTTFFVK